MLTWIQRSYLVYVALLLTEPFISCSSETPSINNGSIECLAPSSTRCLSIGDQISTDPLKVTLIDATPSRPSRGVNRWLIEVETSNDDQCELTQLSLYMPAHNHGSTPAKITERGLNNIEIDQINLLMPGLWDLNFQFKCSFSGILEIYYPLWLEN